MKYKVKIGKDNKFYGLNKNTFEEGEKVTFYVYIIYDASTYVTSDDVEINMEETRDYSRIYYSFIMPNKDVFVNVETKGNMTSFNPDMKSVVEEVKDKNKKYCPDCGLEIQEGTKFCPECGCKQ